MSLLGFLHEQEIGIDERMLLKYALDVASGMSILESNDIQSLSKLASGVFGLTL
jgi:hypothetical protein